MTQPLVWLFWPLFGLYSFVVWSLCLLEVPNNERKKFYFGILASKQNQRSDITSGLKSMSQILLDTIFGLAVLASIHLLRRDFALGSS